LNLSALIKAVKRECFTFQNATTTEASVVNLQKMGIKLPSQPNPKKRGDPNVKGKDTPKL